MRIMRHQGEKNVEAKILTDNEHGVSEGESVHEGGQVKDARWGKYTVLMGANKGKYDPCMNDTQTHTHTQIIILK